MTVNVLFIGSETDIDSQKAKKFLKECDFNVECMWVNNNKEITFTNNLNRFPIDYILCFKSKYILPKKLIDLARIAAINFHPATPDYPGSGGINWALYNNDQIFGVTVHNINEKVDNGKIIKVLRFDLYETDTVETLLVRTYQKHFLIFCEIVQLIAEQGIAAIKELEKESSGENWRPNAYKMKEINQLRKIQPDISRDEFEKIMRATCYQNFMPFTELHGQIFEMKKT